MTTTNALTDETIAKLEAKGLKRWTKGSMDRLYANPWVYGVEFDYYNTGNIKNCTINGKRVSNSEGRRFKATKVYIDIADGSVHIQTATDYESEIRERIEGLLAEVMAEVETENEEEEELRSMAQREDFARQLCMMYTGGKMYGKEAQAFCEKCGASYPDLWDNPTFATLEGAGRYVYMMCDYTDNYVATDTKETDYDMDAVVREITEERGGVYVLREYPSWDIIRRHYVGNQDQ